MPKQSVVVFDSVGVNPYGRELADLLQDAGFTVLLALPRDAVSVDGQALLLRETFGMLKPASLAREVRHLARLGWLILASRCVCIVVWARTYQKVGFAILALLRPQAVVYIAHNPGAGRDVGGKYARLIERIMLARSRVVAHGGELAAAAEEEGAKQVIALPHLPFVRYCERWNISIRDVRRRDVPSILLLGALRPDKLMAHDVREFILELEANGFEGEVVLAVRPRMELDVRGGVRVINFSSDDVLGDPEIAAALNRTDVLAAPYKNVTDSSTIMLALSAGIAVVGPRAGAVSGYLREEWQVAPGDVRGAALLCMSAVDWSVPEGWINRVREESVLGWRRVLENV
ncbi:MAG TPA: hypothetical protein VFA16_17890 [Mycobacterium sp.]|uniref:hypothetical protein n=1 Tax=Mycobacterium sp. TaxID=1785 RepID=UPI002D6EED90|nr:hypothetical protein [Mycobacterium sp.]HZU49103.1 hypothetical protein [Mycobacterium sp.]